MKVDARISVIIVKRWYWWHVRDNVCGVHISPVPATITTWERVGVIAREPLTEKGVVAISEVFVANAGRSKGYKIARDEQLLGLVAGFGTPLKESSVESVSVGSTERMTLESC